MKKEYQKPCVEYVSLVSQEELTSDDLMDGSLTVEDSIFGN